MNALAHPPAPDPAMYHAWRQSGGSLPPNTRVLLGYYASPGALPDDAPFWEGPRAELSFLPFRQLFGRLVVVVSIQVTGLPVCTVAEVEGALVPIWPTTGAPLTWPPAVVLDAVNVPKANTWRLA
jgi:hypothetical protein